MTAGFEWLKTGCPCAVLDLAVEQLAACAKTKLFCQAKPETEYSAVSYYCCTETEFSDVSVSCPELGFR